ncbi:MAG TPA: nitroreductase/quinone reductase family protein [Candidatus Limnocylindrales bacterium]|nr:nitroreductase/quinone reductase family protein [Candidatus Limnocylindrales bacterium]
MPRRLPGWVYIAFAYVVTNHHVARVHRWLIERTHGRGLTGRLLGLDMIVVTTTGRRTGASRTVPLGAVRDGERWLVVGSNAGRDEAPAWALNMEADPKVTVSIGGREPAPFVARRPAGLEADRLWLLVTGRYPGYLDYQARTDRRIPLFVLEPA